MEGGSHVKDVHENEQSYFVSNGLKNHNAKYKIIISHAPFVSTKCDIGAILKLSTCHNLLEDWNETLFNKYHSLFKNKGVDIIL